jgi:hypothetical protein
LGKGSEFYAFFSNSMTEVKNIKVINPSPVSSFYLDAISFKSDGIYITDNRGSNFN